MKQLFMVGAKLLGIYWIAQGLYIVLNYSKALQSYALQVQFMHSTHRSWGHLQWFWVLLTAILALVPLVIGISLTFFTRRIAAHLRTDGLPEETTPISKTSLLGIGIVLLGLQTFLQSAPGTVGDIQYYLSPNFGQPPTAFPWDRVLILVCAGLMVVYAEKIAVFILSLHRDGWPQWPAVHDDASATQVRGPEE